MIVGSAESADSAFHVSQSGRPEDVSFFDSWKAFRACVKFVPVFPSIEPGEKPWRSSRTWKPV